MNLSARHTVTDQMGRSVAVPPEPQRIISLVPAQTELLFDLGLEAEMVGRTKFCVRPADKAAQIPSVAGANQFRFDLIDWLQPDLTIGDKEENYQEGIERIIMVDDICHKILMTLFLLHLLFLGYYKGNLILEDRQTICAPKRPVVKR
jgi:ABC-type hemin transport system substrate-binding protein